MSLQRLGTLRQLAFLEWDFHRIIMAILGSPLEYFWIPFEADWVIPLVILQSAQSVGCHAIAGNLPRLVLLMENFLLFLTFSPYIISMSCLEAIIALFWVLWFPKICFILSTLIAQKSFSSSKKLLKSVIKWGHYYSGQNCERVRRGHSNKPTGWHVSQ